MDVIEEEQTITEGSRRSSGSSDEFGDDDFDAEMVEALGISQRAAADTGNDTTVLAELSTTVPEGDGQQHKPQLRPAAGHDSDDEFGLDDDEEEEFAADLEQVASLYDSRTEVTPTEVEAVPQEGKSAGPVINLVEDDSDEFGDDIDPDEFAAAEIVATQGQSTVCRP
jgi:DNA replication ATP-dependent helicase Dna2